MFFPWLLDRFFIADGRNDEVCECVERTVALEGP
jgi:hypothetical protein